MSQDKISGFHHFGISVCDVLLSLCVHAIWLLLLLFLL